MQTYWWSPEDLNWWSYHYIQFHIYTRRHPQPWLMIKCSCKIWIPSNQLHAGCVHNLVDLTWYWNRITMSGDKQPSLYTYCKLATPSNSSQDLPGYSCHNRHPIFVPLEASLAPSGGTPASHTYKGICTGNLYVMSVLVYIVTNVNVRLEPVEGFTAVDSIVTLGRAVEGIEEQLDSRFVCVDYD